MDDLAAKLNIDPMELFARNADLTARPAVYRMQLEKAAEVSESKKLCHPREKTIPGAVTRGLGLGVGTWGGAGHAVGCRTTIHPDGAVELGLGTQDLGTGTRTTIITMVAAETPGLSISAIGLRVGDNRYPTGDASGGSTTVGGTSSAARKSTINALAKLFETAAPSLDSTPERLEAVDGEIRVKDGGERLSWKEGCGKLGMRSITESGENNLRTPGGLNTGGSAACVINWKFPMKALILCILACGTAVWAQTVPLPPSAAPAPALPELPDSTVIATFEDGARITMGDFRKIYAILPPQNQQMALRDRRTFLQQWAFMRKLSQMADQQKLDQESPTKEALDYYHMMIMSQAKINDAVNSTTVEPGEIVKYYDVNKEKYKQVRVKTIYISFSSGAAAATAPGGKKALTEDAAKAKAAKLLADLRAGADFLKAVKDNSDDETSRAKDGEFASLRPSDNIPDAIKSVVFALKQGELSEPVRQPNGFYLFRAEEVSYRPLSQVRDEIFTTLKQQRYAEWMEKTNKDTKITFNSPAFLGLTPAVPGPGK